MIHTNNIKSRDFNNQKTIFIFRSGLLITTENNIITNTNKNIQYFHQIKTFHKKIHSRNISQTEQEQQKTIIVNNQPFNISIEKNHQYTEEEKPLKHNRNNLKNVLNTFNPIGYNIRTSNLLNKLMSIYGSYHTIKA
jgi:hypothetical protein